MRTALLAASCMLLIAMPAAALAQQPVLDKSLCLGCHGNEGFSASTQNGETRSLFVDRNRFEHSVHGNRQCVECHTDIREIPHKQVPHRVGCINCHEDLWAAARRENKANPRLERVVDKIHQYLGSVHSRPSREDQSMTNAACYECHVPHYIYPPGTQQYTDWRLSLPDICGKCHVREKSDYLESIHAELAVRGHYPGAAVCSDCHTGHMIQPTRFTETRLAITENCANCHRENYKTYTDTYHGQVSKLGYGFTAKCFDCHASHKIQQVSDPRSTVSEQNRLNTCRRCHQSATAGFLTFEPHANTHDFERYPYTWVASKFMIALLLGVFAFFWTHSALWFYREFKDRRAGRARPVQAEEYSGKEVRRFALGWRVAHLLFALSVMTLVLTGMSLFYADTYWAKVIMETLGGPRISGMIHRTAAVTMLSIFFIHVAFVVTRIWRTRRTFQWLGPASLVPRWKDLTDAVAMFKWFLGRGAQPVFDRWTYWEKFDYWAVFWGMAIIGTSGAMLWFPAAVTSVLPGWVLNVAMLIHGEEAFLAAVFLFTVHFFNNHFRPAKYPPPDIVIFTGSVPVEHFEREHALEYRRLVESGELEQRLVDAPPKRLVEGSRALGLALITFGLVLLALVVIGFVHNL